MTGDASILQETETSEEPSVAPDLDDVLDRTAPTGSQETVGEGGGSASRCRR
ncbi:MAG: hypothetical protein ABEI86_13575 [Halobacteriaceae archaeon]